MKTIILIITLLTFNTYNQAEDSQEKSFANQTQRLMAAMQSNYNARQAIENQDWKTAAKQTDQTAKLLQDAIAVDQGIAKSD